MLESGSRKKQQPRSGVASRDGAEAVVPDVVLSFESVLLCGPHWPEASNAPASASCIGITGVPHHARLGVAAC